MGIATIPPGPALPACPPARPCQCAFEPHTSDCRLGLHSQEIRRRLDKDITADQAKMRRLQSVCERAKRDLSAMMKCEVDVCSLVFDDVGILLSRAKFEDLIKDLLSGTIDTVKHVLTSAQVLVFPGLLLSLPCAVHMR